MPDPSRKKKRRAREAEGGGSAYGSAYSGYDDQAHGGHAGEAGYAPTEPQQPIGPVPDLASLTLGDSALDDGPDGQPRPQPGDFDGQCVAPGCSADRAREIGIRLGVRPMPDPVTQKEDYGRWLREHKNWRNPECECGKGYYCAIHGTWVSGAEVSQGLVSPEDALDLGCPESHSLQQDAISPDSQLRLPSSSRDDGGPAGSAESSRSFAASPSSSSKGKKKARAGTSERGNEGGTGIYGSGASYHLQHRAGDYDHHPDAQSGAYWANDSQNDEFPSAQANEAYATHPSAPAISHYHHQEADDQSGSDWMVMEDNGLRYYYNTTTGESRHIEADEKAGYS